MFTRLGKWIGPILGRIHSRRAQLGGFASSAPFYWDIIDIQQSLHSEPLLCGWLLLLESSVYPTSEGNPVLVTSTWPHAQPLNRLFSCPLPAGTADTVYCVLSCLVKEIIQTSICIQTRICCFSTVMNILSCLEHIGSLGGGRGGLRRGQPTPPLLGFNSLKLNVHLLCFYSWFCVCFVLRLRVHVPELFMLRTFTLTYYKIFFRFVVCLLNLHVGSCQQF